MKYSDGQNRGTGGSRSVKKTAQGTLRMLICDDHTLFREGIKSILSGDPSIEVIGEAADGRQAVEYTGRLHPDVILMDVSMPEMIGYEAIRRISKADKNVKILVLTMYEEEEIIGLCLNAGASGYILKDAPAGQLIEAIHIVHEGGKYLSPRAMQKVVNQYIDGSAPLETKYDTLSNREREILKLLADGLSVKDIASRLNLSVKTIDVHKYNLMRKLDLHDKTDLIKYALRRNLISFPAVTHLESHKK